MKFGIAGILGAVLFSISATRVRADAPPPASYFKDVLPILKANCQGCHNPTKTEGKLDLTTFENFAKGGKTGAAFNPGKPEDSLVLDFIKGEKPIMPKNGKPLRPEEVAIIERWIKEGAKNDTPAETADPIQPDKPPIYPAPPTITALAYSPDNSTLAVSGYHEVLLHKADGSAMIGRLVGGAPRIESLAYSPDGKILAVSGGAPVKFGEVEFWNTETRALLASHRFTNDTLYGVSFSPDGKSVAFGGADKSLRVIAVADGKEILKMDNHSDWVFATTFTLDGSRVVSGSRDRAIKLINVANGQFIDDINKLNESVLCMVRHPGKDMVAYGGEVGVPRLYNISDNQKRTNANNDTNLVREFDRQPGAVRAVAFSPDGKFLAIGGVGADVRVYAIDSGKLTMTLKGDETATYSIAWRRDGKQVATGGFDGRLRLFDAEKGDILTTFVPVPIMTLDAIRQAVAGVPAEAKTPEKKSPPQPTKEELLKLL